MSKRHVPTDFAGDSGSKRSRTSAINAPPPHEVSLNFDTSLYDELVLVIFAHLSWLDLCAVQQVNRRWSRLAGDNQLWKALFLREFGRPRLRGIRGYIGRDDGREIKPLPSRASPEDTRDWKWMFRISLNWKNGRCAIERTDKSPSATVDSVPLHDDRIIRTHVVLSGSLTITSLPQVSDRSEIQIRRTALPMHAIYELHKNTPTFVTALSLDQSPPSSSLSEVRLAAFFANGSFAVYSIDHRTPSKSRRLFGYSPISTTSRTSPIIQAVYHHPLLITLSKTFNLSLYNLSGDKVVHTQTLTSFTSFPPSSLVLSMPNSSLYKLILAYAMPVYPAHWSVAVTELTISSSAPTYSVASTRTTRAFDIPPGWITEAKLRSVREQWGRKVGCVADAQTDGKWVVFAPGDPQSQSDVEFDIENASDHASNSSTLQLYRLHLPAQLQSQSSAALPKLTFVRSLHGHMGPVAALSLSDGRCVSLGKDGSLWAWDLENGWDTEIQTAQRDTAILSGSIVFDERQIVSTDHGGIEVRRFDV